MENFVVELGPEEELLKQVVEPLLDSEGFELVQIMLKKAQHKSLLKIFVDTIKPKNAITMEHLLDVSRLLSDVLDATFNEGTVLNGPYDLEVSSPGLDRPLTKHSHFLDAILKKVKVRIKNTDTAGSKNIVGILREVLDDSVIIESELNKEDKVSISYQNMVYANIVFEFSKPNEDKKKSKVRARS